ncbi:hypothetical protein QFC19_002542 [Naganishia cerealis]|uniref:Uncharacterized protein n=1 Tax=Naganishia cerealis TaxID=610337 RepID=A0ACC2WBW6_9TREE|nr:hypothetical protein QFC19_002542 [Naganishia cerealis]
MESLTIVDTEGHSMGDESKPLVFHQSYNDPSANVVLTSADDISFRVDDFHLKSASLIPYRVLVVTVCTICSPVFREMPSLLAKGGPIKLPATTAVIRIVLDNLANIESKDAPSLQTMVKAWVLAKRFDLKGVIIQIKVKLHGYKDGPRLLALACQQVPIDRPLARTALSRFEMAMSKDPAVFRDTWFHAAVDQTNMKTEFIESLTVAGYYAFSKALTVCDLGKDAHHRRKYDWGRVPNEFIKALAFLGR